MRKINLFLLGIACSLLIITYLTEGGVPSFILSSAGPDTSQLKYLNWYNASPDSLEIQGAWVEKAYREILNAKNSRTVVVAVIDGGVDINHEDLQGHIWTNEKEVPGNGIDDDHNGFIDDIHGWNFLGNAKGENITYETLEITRIVKKFDTAFNNVNPAQLLPGEKADYITYQTAKKEFDEKLKRYKAEKDRIDPIYKGYIIANNNIKSYLNKDSFSIQELRTLDANDEMIKKSRNYLLYLHDIDYTLKDLEEIKENNYNHLYYHLNPEYNPRELIGDDPEKSGNESYGNNDVTGEKPEHGTFVSGIIAGVRNNDKGINGIVSNVQIMTLRVVPDGDERDKDVANAIIYAVNNGAEVINCSFGKNFSPQKELVDAALRLARQKGVIVIHASGNDATNNDKIKHYPTPVLKNGETVSDNWFTVGASSMKAGKTLAGKFSNYGRSDVDLFAPGVDICSLHPNNTYDVGDGTSYASPVVAGVVALLKSYYPDLTAAQIKVIMMQSVTKFPGLKVYVPLKKGKQKKKIRFEKLSASGGLVNAYQAVKEAEKLSLHGNNNPK